MTPLSLKENIKDEPSRRAWAVAVLAVTVSGLLRFALNPILGDNEPLLLFPYAVVVASLYGGFGPGAAATLVSAFTADYLFVRPRYTLFLWDPAAASVMMIVFVALGVVVSLVVERFKRAKAELKRSASALQKSEFQLSTLVATVPEILFTATPDGATDYVNTRFIDYSGMESDALLGAGWFKMIHPDDRERTIAAWTKSVETGDEFEITYRLRGADAAYRWFQCHALRVEDSQTQDGHWFGVCTDIHEHKELEESLAVHTKELQRTNEDLQSFAHVAAHDLQEPLRTIGVFSQLLAEKTRGKVNKEADTFVEHILGGVARMKNLIRDLLDCATARHAEAAPRYPTNLNGVVHSAIEHLHLAVREADAIIVCDRLPSVIVNANGMVRVFQNLISNAIKYKSAGRPCIHITSRADGDEWVLSVEDNGIGFDMRHANRVFEAFRRLHSYAEVPGTGIGLAIVRQIVDDHGGRVWAESEPGRGSKFFFTLPKNAEDVFPEDELNPMIGERTAIQARSASAS